MAPKRLTWRLPTLHSIFSNSIVCIDFSPALILNCIPNHEGDMGGSSGHNHRIWCNHSHWGERSHGKRHDQKGKIPHNCLVVVATSNLPIPSLQPVAGGDQKKQQQQRKASNSQQVFLSSNIESPFDWKRKEDDELSVTVVANSLSLTCHSN